MYVLPSTVGIQRGPGGASFARRTRRRAGPGRPDHSEEAMAPPEHGGQGLPLSGEVNDSTYGPYDMVHVAHMARSLALALRVHLEFVLIIVGVKRRAGHMPSHGTNMPLTCAIKQLGSLWGLKWSVR